MFTKRAYAMWYRAVSFEIVKHNIQSTPVHMSMYKPTNKLSGLPLQKLWIWLNMHLHLPHAVGSRSQGLQIALARGRDDHLLGTCLNVSSSLGTSQVQNSSTPCKWPRNRRQSVSLNAIQLSIAPSRPRRRAQWTQSHTPLPFPGGRTEQDEIKNRTTNVD